MGTARKIFKVIEHSVTYIHVIITDRYQTIYGKQVCKKYIIHTVDVVLGNRKGEEHLKVYGVLMNSALFKLAKTLSLI